MAKKCLFIAGLGMMGSACAEYMRDHHPELEIFAADDFSGSHEDDAPAGINFKRMDLRDTAVVKEYFDTTFKDRELTYVINFAASAREIYSFFGPIDTMSRNTDLFRNVLTNALNHKVKHVTYFSSMSRYGNGLVYNGDNDLILSQPVPFKEDYMVAPCDPYATSKVACELLLKAMKHVYNFEYTIFVPHNCFSPKQFVEPYRNYLAIWLNLILLGKQPTIYGKGDSLRALSWVNDFNPIICESIFNEDAYSQTFNIGGDVHHSIAEWYTLVKRITGTNLNPIFRDGRPGEVTRAYCDHTKAANILGFKNTTKVEDAIAEMWEYFKAKGPRPFKYIEGFEINSDKIPVTWSQKLF